MQDFNRGINDIFERGNASNAEQAVSVAIPKKFTKATLEKEKGNLREKMHSISQENITLGDRIKALKNDTNYRKEKAKCDAQLSRTFLNKEIEESEKIWAGDKSDYRYRQIQEKQLQNQIAIHKKYNDTQKEIGQVENEIPLLENKISENKHRFVYYKNELDKLDDQLKNTELERTESHYQQLLDKKNSIPLNPNSFKSDSYSNTMIDNLIELTEEFGEMEDYKNSKTLKQKCLDLAIRIHYNSMARQKSELDSSETTTPNDYMALANEFREARGYADTENLAKECENRAVVIQYNQLLRAKNNASTENEFQSLARQFMGMNGYANTVELANECANQYRTLKEQREEREKRETAERELREAREKKEREERDRSERREKWAREEQEQQRIQKEETQVRRIFLCAIIIVGLLTTGYFIAKNGGWFNKKKVMEPPPQSIQSSVQQNQDTRVTTVNQVQKTNPTIPGRYPQASERLLTASDLRYLSKKELGIMRNEIFARHGYIFQTPQWKAYFQNQNWYSPKNSNVNSLLSGIELENVTRIKSYE